MTKLWKGKIYSRYFTPVPNHQSVDADDLWQKMETNMMQMSFV